MTSASAPNRVFTLGSLTGGAAAQLNPIAGTGQAGSLGDAGTALLAQFNLKTDSLGMRSGVAVAADGTLFIADTLNSTIRRISGADSSESATAGEPGIVRSIAGRWADAQAENGAGVTLTEPMGLALDRAGNLYITDYAAGAVDILPAATSATPGALEILAHVASPSSIAVTADGRRVFVASPITGFVTSIDTTTRAIRAVAGLTVNGASAAATSSAARTNNCGAAAENPPAVCPAGLAADGSGNLFIADANGGQILRVDAQTGATKIAVTGLSLPGDMAFDSKGNLYLSEQGHDRILEIKGLGVPVSNLTITAPAALPPPTPPLVCTALVNQPQAFNFCDMLISGNTGAQAFIVTNNTAGAVTALTIAMNPAVTPANFTIQGSTCTPTLSAGASCTVNLEFTPQQDGEIDSALTATDAAGDTASSEVGGTGTDFQLALASGQSTQMTVAQGGSVTFNLQVIPDAIFSGSVTYVCPPAATINSTTAGFMPPYTTCTFSPTSQTISPGTAANFSVTFKTTYNYIPPGQTALPAAPASQPGAGGRMLLFPALAILALAAFLWSANRAGKMRRRFRFALPAAALAGMVMAAGLLGACHHSTPNPAIQTTPTGTTTMTVSATCQGVTQGVPITLEVVAP